MKIAYAAAALVAAAAFAAPALAGDGPHINWYGNVGYTDLNASDGDLGAVTGRVGGRGTHFGIEAEGSFGVNTVTSGGANVKLNSQYGAYAVAYAPVADGNADLFARVGYLRTNFHASAGGLSGSSSFNGYGVGVGGQYFFGHGANGVRADYTYEHFENVGGHANVYGISYVRKF